ncbi:hypothetical protein EX30DRAFT_364167 [Ascodesmis nigricans]|uniref:Ecp2 effector protein domain-containing protein n=1 Tax=Ascodesmis nigricans TaxID=341454 RepID=A0A4S2MW12_9PEZI|nr:hypothetical protein EX30DRAFT_364167 [Ascodesmis nigricans]
MKLPTLPLFLLLLTSAVTITALPQLPSDPAPSFTPIATPRPIDPGEYTVLPDTTPLRTTPAGDITPLSAWTTECYNSGLSAHWDVIVPGIEYYCNKYDGHKVARGGGGLKMAWLFGFWACPYHESRLCPMVVEYQYYNIGGSTEGWLVKKDECIWWFHYIIFGCSKSDYTTRGGKYHTSSGYVKMDPEYYIYASA